LCGGCIVSVDPTIGVVTGDVLVRNGLIAQVGVIDLSLTDDAEIIDATNMIVLPGFVDTHRHTWQTAVRHRNGALLTHPWVV